MGGFSWLAADPFASQEELCSMEFVCQLVTWLGTFMTAAQRKPNVNKMFVRYYT